MTNEAWPTGTTVGISCAESGAHGLIVFDLDVRDGFDGIRRWLDVCRLAGHEHAGDVSREDPVRGPEPVLGARRTRARARSDWRPAIDLRGPGTASGGYVVGPGSHVCREMDEAWSHVQKPFHDIVRLPDWLAHLLGE